MFQDRHHLLGEGQTAVDHGAVPDGPLARNHTRLPGDKDADCAAHRCSPCLPIAQRTGCTCAWDQREWPQTGHEDHRLRIIFSNGMESDPLLSSFRKALADDPTARAIHRHGLGAMDPEWEADRIDLTGTVYVVRSLSRVPQIAEVRTRRMLAGFGDCTLTFADRAQASKYIAAELRVGTYYLDYNESGIPDYEVRHINRVPAHLRDMIDPISCNHYRAIEDSKG